jgi:hypothetical protein
MGLFLRLCAGLCLLADTPPDAAPGDGSEPPETVCVLRLKGQDEPVHVFAHKEDFVGAKVVLVEVDEYPEGRDKRSIRTEDIVEIWEERPSATRRRHRRILEEHGLVEVKGRFVPEAEVEYARRARELMRLRDAAAQAQTPAQPAVDTGDGGEPGFLARRWPELGVAALALLLIAVIAKKMIFS